MKILIVETLYAVGIVVYAAWLLGNREFISALKKEEDDWFSTLPESAVNAVLVAAVFILGITWPYRTVCQLLEDLKK